MQKDDAQYVQRLIARIQELEREIALLQQDKALLEHGVRRSRRPNRVNALEPNAVRVEVYADGVSDLRAAREPARATC